MNRRGMRDLGIMSLLIALGVLSRVIPHPPNFTAVSALALFASFYFASWKLGPAVTLGTLILSDVVVGGYEPRLMAAVYASSLLPLVFGRLLRHRLMPGRMVACAISSSVAFFLATNLAVWLFGNWYANDWHGLVACFTAGIPFFRYTLGGDVVFSCVIFGSYALAVHRRELICSARSIWISTRSVLSRREVPEAFACRVE